MRPVTHTPAPRSADKRRRALATLLPALALLVVLEAAPAQAAGGKEAFESECSSCHTLDGVSTPSGPSLKGLFWRKIASAPGFRYSAALRAKIGNWTPQRLDAFLKDTQAFAPGGDMFFVVKDRADRQAIVNYLKSAP